MRGGALLSAGSRLLVVAAGAATTIVLAHVLGPSGFGAFAVAQTLLALLLTVTTLGIEHGIVYYVSSGRWSARSAFAASQLMALASGLAGCGAGVLARVVAPSAFHGLSMLTVAIASAALPFALSWLYGSYIALAEDRYRGFVLPPAAQAALVLALTVVGGVVDGAPGAVFGLAGSHALTAVGTLLTEARRRTGATPPTNGEPQLIGLRRAAAFGIKGYLANTLNAINNRVDLLFLNGTAAAAVVGHYSIAVSVTNVVALLPAALSDVLFPRVAALNARAGSGHELAAVEARAIRHAVLATIAATAVLVLVLLFLVVPIYGPGFQQSTGLGLILLPGAGLLALAGPFAGAIVGRGRPGLMLVATLAVTPPTLALYAILIPSLHATGAAIASTVSYATVFALTAAFFGRLSGRNPLALMMPTRSELADYRELTRSLLPSRSGRARSASAKRV